MDSLEDHRFWLRKSTYRLLKRAARWRRLLKIGLVIGGALIAGAAGTGANLLDPRWRWQYYAVQLIGLIMVFAGATLVEFLDEGAAEAISRANELADAVEARDSAIASLEQDFRYFTTLYSIAMALREMIEGLIAAGPGSEDTQERRLGAMLDVVVADRSILFGMDSDRYNFAIYLYEPAVQRLDCVACRRPIRVEEEARHRSWEPGEGHVGLAFQIGREIVAPDTSDPAAQALFDAPAGKRRDNDRERYRSIASLPIRLAGEEAYGVLVATSDVPERFHLPEIGDKAARDPVEPLRILANALAMAIKAADIYRVEGKRES
jgi:hypothetical protein